ncbi:MAG: low molecular weight protein-tyrosine-phosphatase [Sedimenticola sp.]
MFSKISILIVCTANICRSPMAESLLENRLQRTGLSESFSVDSAGTHAMGKGTRPDPRVEKVLHENNIEVKSRGSRSITQDDFEAFDHILVMDNRNYDYLMEMCPEEHKGKIRFLMDYDDSASDKEVPDPYYGNLSGFERVYRILDQSITRFIEHINSNRY